MWSLAVNQLPMVGMTVLWLVFLEGLLSADNALVMAMMVRHLPKPEQKRVLAYGIWGAFAFRLVAVGLASYLLDLWYLKVAGGLYLLYLAVAHFASKRHGDDAKPSSVDSRFWRAVILVELADIAFSIDSILAAVALAEEMEGLTENEKIAIVITGGFLGIITMRYVASYFIGLLERFRGLEPGAYLLVAWIGLKLIVSGLHSRKLLPFAINEWVFWIGMIAIVAVSFLYKPTEKKPPRPQEEETLIEEVARIACGGDEVGEG